MTRTYRWARIHLNGQYTIGDQLPATSAAAFGTTELGPPELSRWLAGAAIDRTLPLRSMLVGGELFARQPLVAGESVELNAGGGVRYQLSPTLAVDGGVGGRLNGEAKGWYVTFGTAYAFGLVR